MNVGKMMGLDPTGQPEPPRFPFRELAAMGEPWIRYGTCRTTYNLRTARQLAATGNPHAARVVNLLEQWQEASELWKGLWLEWVRTARKAGDSRRKGVA